MYPHTQIRVVRGFEISSLVNLISLFWIFCLLPISWILRKCHKDWLISNNQWVYSFGENSCGAYGPLSIFQTQTFVSARVTLWFCLRNDELFPNSRNSGRTHIGAIKARQNVVKFISSILCRYQNWTTCYVCAPFLLRESYVRRNTTTMVSARMVTLR